MPCWCLKKRKRSVGTKKTLSMYRNCIQNIWNFNHYWQLYHSPVYLSNTSAPIRSKLTRFCPLSTLALSAQTATIPPLFVLPVNSDVAFILPASKTRAQVSQYVFLDVTDTSPSVQQPTSVPARFQKQGAHVSARRGLLGVIFSTGFRFLGFRF